MAARRAVPVKTRRVKTDVQRATDELALYERRVVRAQKAMATAQAALEAATAEYEAVLPVRDHLLAHPALAQLHLDDEVKHPDTAESEPAAGGTA